MIEDKVIFEPILNEIISTATRLSIEPTRKIRLATSTSTGASPLSRPTGDTHLLFIGLGTSTFCNYWAKAITAIIIGLTEAHGVQRIERRDAVAALKGLPDAVHSAIQLTLFYAASGTLIGFGEIRQPDTYLPYRSDLLERMETFVIAHEYSHFVAEERLPGLNGHDLEYFCDEFGLMLCRNTSAADENWLEFTGIGPLVFFRCFQLCETARKLLSSRLNVESSNEETVSHPAIENRIQRLKRLSVEKTAPDQQEAVQQFLEEYDIILVALSDLVRTILAEAIQEWD